QFRHRLIRFRHFIDGSLALASLNRTCRTLVATFPQRSPPWLLTTAACGGLRSTPDCRPRRALLHLSYSCASPCGPALLVTQDPSGRVVHNGRSGWHWTGGQPGATGGPHHGHLGRVGGNDAQTAGASQGNRSRTAPRGDAVEYS